MVVHTSRGYNHIEYRRNSWSVIHEPSKRVRSTSSTHSEAQRNGGYHLNSSNKKYKEYHIGHRKYKKKRRGSDSKKKVWEKKEEDRVLRV